MRINELFTNASVSWTWEQKTTRAASAEFKIKGEPYEFESRRIDDIWYISFSSLSGEPNDTQYDINGLGSSATVMSTVVGIIRDFLQSYPTAKKLQFSAYETSRRSLYAKMVQRLLPAWKLEKSEDNIVFMLIHPDHVSESVTSNVTELFTNGAVPWKWITGSENEASAQFRVGEEEFEFTADNKEHGWEIAFSVTNSPGTSYGITGKGNASIVLATVVDILGDFLQTYPDVNTLVMVAFGKSRQSLYAKMIQRLLPTWVVEKAQDGRIFILTRPVQANESQSSSIIHEIMTKSSVPWRWRERSSNLFVATFDVGTENYEFQAAGRGRNWYISFESLSNDDGYGMTGTGNAATIMSTIVDIMRDFFKIVPEIQTIKFIATEHSRQLLYTRIVRRLLPTWQFSNSSAGTGFTLSRPVSENKNRDNYIKINELFTRVAVPWKWKKNDRKDAVVEFVVNGENYEFNAESVDDYGDAWYVDFAATNGESMDYSVNGKGNAATVMSTVVDIMRSFLSSRASAYSIAFSAKEPSRQSLYTKMITRLLPSWRLSKADDGEYFMLTAPDANESN